MSRFLNSKYRELEAYTPGEQPTDMKYIKLNTNESPYPPSQRVLDAVNSAEVAKLNLYSDPTCKALKSAVAELFGKRSYIYGGFLLLIYIGLIERNNHRDAKLKKLSSKKKTSAEICSINYIDNYVRALLSDI